MRWEVHLSFVLLRDDWILCGAANNSLWLRAESVGISGPAPGGRSFAHVGQERAGDHFAVFGGINHATGTVLSDLWFFMACT